MTSLPAFLAANPGTDLQTADLFSAHALAQYNWPADTGQKLLLQSLRIRQRLLKLYPDENVAEILESLGFHSAHHIASVGAAAFAQKAAPQLAALAGIPDATAVCAKISGNAERIRRASFELALARPRELQLTATPAISTNPDFQQGSPDYERLFGPIITCDCDECQSIFGPSAYFTDLMRIVTQYVAAPLEELFTLQYRRPDLWTLRLDCANATTEVRYIDIVISILQDHIAAHYTDGGEDPMQLLASAVYPFSAPYNQPLQTVWDGMKGMDTSLPELYRVLETQAPAAGSAALHLSPEAVALITGAQDETLSTIYGLHTTVDTGNTLFELLGNQRTFLQQTGLQPGQLTALIYQDLNESHGDFCLSTSGSSGSATGNAAIPALTGDYSIEMWVYPKSFPSDASSRTNPICKSYSGEFAITVNPANFNGQTNAAGAFTAYFGNEQTACNESTATYYTAVCNDTLQLEQWNHIAVTRKAANGQYVIYLNGVQVTTYTPASYTALAAPTTCPVIIGHGYGQCFDGLISEVRIWDFILEESEVAANMYNRVDPSEYGRLIAYWPLNEQSGTVAKDLGSGSYDATNTTGAVFQYNNSLPIETYGNSGELMQLFYLNGVLPQGQYLNLRHTDLENKTAASIVVTDGSEDSLLTEDVLLQLAVYVRLQLATGWTFSELDWALKSVAGTQKTVDNTIIEKLGAIAGLVQEYNIPVDEVCSFWYDMKTYGRGKSTEPEDLWDRVYNTPPLMKDDQDGTEPIFYRPAYEYNPLFKSAAITWTFGSGAKNQDLQLNSQLAAALNISASDLMAIVTAVVGSSGDTSLNLSVEQLSQFYRIARFAQMLKMNVPDFISFVQTCGLWFTAPSLTWSMEQVTGICKKVAWLQQSKLTVSQFVYLSSGIWPAGLPILFDPVKINTALAGMVQASTPLLVTPGTFVSDRADTVTAQAIFDQLVATGYIDNYGLVLNVNELTPQKLYEQLAAAGSDTAAIHRLGEQPYINFSAANSGLLQFNFDPFADETIQQTNSFTISMWLCPASTMSSGWPRMIGYIPPGGGNAQNSPAIRQDQNKNYDAQFSYGDGSSYFAMSAAVFKEDAQWVFISWVNDNGVWSLYRNGKATPFTTTQTSFPKGIYTQTSTPAYQVGYAYTGAVCNVSIWKTARTAIEIQQDMLSQNFTGEPGLLAWWPMNENTGTTVYNHSADPQAVNGLLTESSSGGYTWATTPTIIGMLEAARICNLLLQAQSAQNDLAVKTLAPLAGVNAATMNSICILSGNEVNNKTGLGTATDVPYAANMLLVPDDGTNPNKKTFLEVLLYNSQLTKWLKLNDAEVLSLKTLSAAFGTGTLTYGTYLLTAAQVQTVSTYKSLARLCTNADGLLAYFRMAPASGNQPTTGQVSWLAAQTGWEDHEITAACTYFSGVLPAVNFNTVQGVAKLWGVMQLESKLGMNMAALGLLQSLAALDLFDASTTDASWQTYLNAAAAVQGSLTSKKGTAAAEKLQDALRIKTRDALCNWIIWELGANVDGVKNDDELYEYLLIDVKMSPAVKISSLVAGMNSLQLYVNRCISNMEAGAVNNIPERWWEWMSTYRVWQANREVYLYPENYVDPTLRKFQSVQFKQFISDVSKGQITDENVRQAMAAYLEKVQEVSSLELTDGYIYPVVQSLPGTANANEKNALLLAARSRTAPRSFYTRVVLGITDETLTGSGTLPADATEMSFGPWQEINLKINADYVSTAVAFGRQFIFWVEQTQVVNSNASGEKYTTVYGTIYYSYRDFSDTWVAPVVLQQNIIIDVSGQGLAAINYYENYLIGARMGSAAVSKGFSFYNDVAWNKVQLQYLPATATTAESILVLFGDMVTCTSTVTTPPPQPGTSGMVPEQADFQKKLYLAAKLAYANKSLYTTIIPGIMLFASLRQKEVYPAINTSGALVLGGTLEQADNQTQLSFAATASLLSPPLPEKISWWPTIYNEGLIEGTAVTDIVSGHSGTISGSMGGSVGKFPDFPDANIPQFTTSNNINFDWSANYSNSSSTLSFWLNMPSISANQYILRFPLYNSTSITRLYCCITYNSNTLILFYYLKNSSSYSNVSFTITPNTWYYVTIVTTDSGVQIFLNGSLQAAPAMGVISNFNMYSRLYVGGFNGYSFGIQYWNIALTAQQVQLAYHNSAGTAYLSGLHRQSTSLARLSNSAGTFAFNTENQSYLAFPNLQTKLIASCLAVSFEDKSNMLRLSFSGSPLPSGTTNPAMKFVRINTDVFGTLISELATGGIDALLAPSAQYLSEEDLTTYSPSSLVVLPGSNYMDFNGAFGIYFWEIFFYAPYLLAEKLRTSRRYNEAEKWFRYIFDPASQNGLAAYWPINRSMGGKFPDMNPGLPATYSGVTELTDQQVPFDYNPRSVWQFNPNSSPQVAVPYSPLLNPDTLTLTAWINLAAMPASGSPFTVVNSQNGTTGYHLYVQYSSSNNFTVQFVVTTSANSGGYLIVTSKPVSYPASWMHVAGRFDGKLLTVYINGVNASSSVVTTSGTTIKNTTVNLYIGSGNSSSKTTWYFNGSIADVMLYPYALPDPEINHLYEDYKNFGLNAAFWNFRPFRRINATSLYHILNGTAWNESFFQPVQYYSASLQMAVYAYDPFDPDTIARLRINSWQKAAFMRYVENLLNWGDALFTQDTWESLSDATMRYEIAAALLGRFPVKEVTEPEQPVVNYAMIAAAYAGDAVPPFLVEMENQLNNWDASSMPLPQQVQSIVDAYFCVPSNKQLLKYWELVADRLYKLRHGLTITGVPNAVPLFAAPIDPNALVAAAGNIAGSSFATTIPAVPWFRFSYMIAQAKSVTAEVSRLGSELLAALEKKDAEHLAQLQAGYQLVIYNLTGQVKASQINQLQYVGEGLQASYDNAVYVHNTYSDWMEIPVGPLEALSLLLAADSAIGVQIAAGVKALAVPAFLLPDIFGLADGGMSPGDSVNAASGIIEAEAHLIGAAGQMMAQMGQYVRREMEWGLQKNIAGNQMREIQAQIKANDFALEAAKTEASLNHAQLEQSQEVYDFLKTKFTNEELYTWMAGQLSTLYFQMFQLAWSLAQSTQSALQYELNLDQSFLNSAAWNASYQGLLAGDALSLALQQMDSAYISGNNRKLEIRKTWSMRQNNPQALLTLVGTGNCRFDLNELSYDLDFPGHYNRKIKSLSVTIPAVVGPYQNIHATLIQTGNTVVMKPSVAAVQYLTGVSTTVPADGSLRVNWNPNQEIIISTGVNDAGVFQVNFNDEQYLPFEGTGAVSSWSLSIPQAANAFPLRSISDVIVTVEYTAEDGGSSFASEVTALSPLTDYKGFQYLSMRQLYSAAWFNFCNNPAGGVYSLTFELVTQMYPANLDSGTVTLGNESGEIGLFLATATGDSPAGLNLQLNNGAATTWPLPDYQIAVSSGNSAVAVPGKGNPWTLKATDIPAGLLTDDNTIDQTKLQDIILIIPFSGTLSW